MATAKQQAVERIQRQSVVTSADFRRLGFRTALLTELRRDGLLAWVDRGVYVNPDYPITEHHSLVAATARLPLPSVVCLLSALRFHELGTQDPPDIWLAVEQAEGKSTWRPTTWMPLRLTRWEPQFFGPGQELHLLEGREVRVYNVAKTVVDCFRLRRLVGLAVFLEALEDAWRRRLVTMQQLAHYASLGEKTVIDEIRPYLEALAV